MYSVQERDIDYVLQDLQEKGIETEDLRLSLLDHICCIAENELQQGDDFYTFYHANIQRFYTKHLREIEEEYQLLLLFKNYYQMKKLLYTSGAFLLMSLLSTSVFNLMHWPGRNIVSVVTVFIFCFLFIPLLCITLLKKYKGFHYGTPVSLGAISIVLFTIALVCKMMHWPGGGILLVISLLSMLCSVGVLLYKLYVQPRRMIKQK
jgi:hypothetical protein